MRQSAGDISQTPVGVIVGQLPFKIVRRRDAEILHPLDQDFMDKVDRLEAAVDLLGQHQRQALERLLFFGEIAVAQI